MTQAGGSTCGCPVCHLAPRGQPHVSGASRVSAMFQTGHDAHVTPPGCPCLESAPASPSAALLLPHPSLEGSSLFSTCPTPQAPKVPPRCHFQLTLPPQPRWNRHTSTGKFSCYLSSHICLLFWTVSPQSLGQSQLSQIPALGLARKSTPAGFSYAA